MTTYNCGCTEKQQKFCEEYIKSGNATAAYLRAYPNAQYNTANAEAPQLLKKPHIKKYLEWLRERVKAPTVADIQECLELLTDIMRNGDTNGEKLKAAELRLKTLGAFIDKKKIEVDKPTVIKVSVTDGDNTIA